MNTLALGQDSFELSADQEVEDGRKGLKTTPLQQRVTPRATTMGTPLLTWLDQDKERTGR